MSYVENAQNKTRGLLDFARTPSGVPKEKGTVYELTPGEQRSLLAKISEVLHYYATAVAELDAPHSVQPDDNVYARIENDVHKAATDEKSARLSLQARELAIESKGTSTSRQSQLLIDKSHLLGERLGTPKAAHQEMTATWEMLHQYIKSNSVEPKELQMKLLAIFNSPILGAEYVHAIEAEIRDQLNRLRRYCDKLAKMTTLGDSPEDTKYHQGYKNISMLLKANLQLPEITALISLLKQAAVKIKELERTNNPALQHKSDLELVRYLTAQTEASEAK